MSIDHLLNLPSSIKAVVSPKGGDAPLRGSGVNFDEVLGDVSTALELQQNGPERLVALAQLSQVQMLQSLFWDDEDADEDFFAVDSGLGGFSLMQAQKSQYIDRYTAAQQPSIAPPSSLARHDIDMLIDQVAEKFSLAPALVHSVVAAESDYRIDAVSPVGAQGLMQLMPETAKELGVSDSFDARENLSGGSRYLKQLLDKYDGDLDHALAAYNWGQGNVDRYGLAKMPAETRNYIAKIKLQLAGHSG